MAIIRRHQAGLTLLLMLAFLTGTVWAVVMSGVELIGGKVDVVEAQSSSNLPYSKTVGDPVEADDGIPIFGPWGATFTIDHFYCIVDPAGTGESVTIVVQESDASGDPSATLATLVCDNDGYTACASGCDTTITDSSIAAERIVSYNTTTVTGTVSLMMVTMRGKE